MDWDFRLPTEAVQMSVTAPAVATGRVAPARLMLAELTNARSQRSTRPAPAVNELVLDPLPAISTNHAPFEIVVMPSE